MNQIKWTLRDRFTNEVFTARQDISTDHAVLYSSVVSERPLLESHIYETLKVSVPAALLNKIKPANEESAVAESRLGIARGTHVMTARGEIRVEHLKVGDRVITRDHGMQRIHWIGSQKCLVTPESAPIVFRQGAIKNARDLVVSADHRIVLKGAEAMMLYCGKEVVVPARKLVNGDTVIQAVAGSVEYFQIVTAQHEVIYCEAAANESFMADKSGIASLCLEKQEDILNALPSLASGNYGPTALSFDKSACSRPIISRSECK